MANDAYDALLSVRRNNSDIIGTTVTYTADKDCRQPVTINFTAPETVAPGGNLDLVLYADPEGDGPAGSNVTGGFQFNGNVGAKGILLYSYTPASGSPGAATAPTAANPASAANFSQKTISRET